MANEFIVITCKIGFTLDRAIVAQKREPSKLAKKGKKPEALSSFLVSPYAIRKTSVCLY
jgi:hypothetical protein